MADEKPKGALPLQLPSPDPAPSETPLAAPEPPTPPALGGRMAKESQKKELVEVSERVMLARIVMNDRTSTEAERVKLLEMILGMAEREAQRATDLFTSQRNFIYAQSQSNKELHAIVSAVLQANIDTTNKLGTAIVEAANANARTPASKALEYIEIFNAVSQVPIIEMGMGMAMEWLVEKKAARDAAKKKEEAKKAAQLEAAQKAGKK